MDELTIPFLGPSGGAGSTRSGRCCAAGRGPRDGLRLERLDRRTRCSRWRSRSSGATGVRSRRAGRRSCPTSGSTSSTRWPAFTAGSAYVNHLDDETGSLEVGKLADLAVLDRDLFDRGAGAIGEARVVATFVEGVAVYEDARARRLSRGPDARRPAWTHDDVDSASDVGVRPRAGEAMLSLRPGTTGRQKGETEHERLRDLRGQRAPGVPDRAKPPAQPMPHKPPSRASASGSPTRPRAFRLSVATAKSATSSILPKLEDYPVPGLSLLPQPRPSSLR